MFEKVYRVLLKLYPDHFRRAYGDEALRLVLDRASHEKGLLRKLRLWVDLLVDLAISLPREYGKSPRLGTLAATNANGDPSFQLLKEGSVSPALLFLAGTLTAASFWACITVLAHSRTFPTQFPTDSYSLQAVVQSEVALARLPSEAADAGAAGAYSVCLTARRDIPSNSLQPLMRFDFAAPGASGAALLDGNIVKTFKNERRLWLNAGVSAGNHWLVLRVDRSAENASLSGNGDLKYCPASF